MAKQRRGRGGGNGGNGGRGRGGGRGKGNSNSSSPNKSNNKKSSPQQLGNIEALKGVNFGYDRNAPNVFDENCEMINNYLASELKVGADMLQELTTLEEVVLVEPTIDPNNPQYIAQLKRETNRKEKARRELKLIKEQIVHYAGLLAAANTGTRDKVEIFRLQEVINGFQAQKDDAELELSYDKQFEFKGQEGNIHDKDIDAYMKRKAKLEADRVICHAVYKGVHSRRKTALS